MRVGYGSGRCRMMHAGGFAAVGMGVDMQCIPAWGVEYTGGPRGIHGPKAPFRPFARRGSTCSRVALLAWRLVARLLHAPARRRSLRLHHMTGLAWPSLVLASEILEEGSRLSGVELKGTLRSDRIAWDSTPRRGTSTGAARARARQGPAQRKSPSASVSSAEQHAAASRRRVTPRASGAQGQHTGYAGASRAQRACSRERIRRLRTEERAAARQRGAASPSPSRGRLRNGWDTASARRKNGETCSCKVRGTPKTQPLEGLEGTRGNLSARQLSGLVVGAAGGRPAATLSPGLGARRGNSQAVVASSTIGSPEAWKLFSPPQAFTKLATLSWLSWGGARPSPLA